MSIGVRGGGPGGGGSAPQYLRILANLGKFGQSLRFFQTNLSKVYDISGRMYWIFWAIILFLFFFGQERSAPPPHSQVAQYAYEDVIGKYKHLFVHKKHVFCYEKDAYGTHRIFCPEMSPSTDSYQKFSLNQ